MPRIGRARLAALAALGLAGALVQPIASVSAAPPVPRTPSFPAAIESAGDYQAQKICDPIPRPGVNAVKQLLLQTYGDRVIYIPRYGCSGTSEHHEGRALDWMINARVASQKATADAFIAWLLRTDQYGNTNAMAKRMGVMYIIWNNRMWRAYDPGRGWTDYKSCSTRTSSGNDTECHRDHVHISFTWDGAMAKTSWYTGKVLPGAEVCAPMGGATGAPPAANNEFFVPVAPTRLVDSSRGIGTADARSCRLEQDDYAGQGRRMDVQVTGKGGVPTSGVSAVALSLRIGTNAPSSVQVWPTGTTKPSTIQISAGAGNDGRSTVVVPVGTGGRISLATDAGAQWVTADVVGYYTEAAGLLFTPVNPWRSAASVVIPPGQERSVKLGGRNGFPTSGIAAVSASITTRGSGGSGGLRIRAFGGSAPSVDTVVYRSAVTRTASVAVPAKGDGGITLANLSPTASVTVDVDPTGYWSIRGMSYAASRGGRVLDTRAGLGASGAVTAGRTITFPVRGVAGVPTSVRAVALQLTAVKPTGAVSATVWPTGRSAPNGVQFTSEGAARGTQYVVAAVGSDGRVALRGSGASTDYQASVVGWWTPSTRTGTVSGVGSASPPPTPAPTPTSPGVYTLASRVSPGAIVVPGVATITGQVLPASAAAGKRVVVQRWINREWKDLASVTVKRDGTFVYGTAPTVRGTYLYRVWKPSDGCTAGRCTWRGGITGSMPLSVAQRYSVGIGLASPTISLGTTAAVQGSVSPALAGSRVIVQRWSGGQWRTLGSATVRESGRYSYLTKPSRAGGFVYRTWKPSDLCTGGACLLRANVSRTITLTVR